VAAIAQLGLRYLQQVFSLGRVSPVASGTSATCAVDQLVGQTRTLGGAAVFAGVSLRWPDTT